MHFADNLIAAIKDKGGPICVGLDPVFERLPHFLQAEDPATNVQRIEAIETFCNGVIETVAEIVPCIKPQSACFERYGAAGAAVYHRVIAKGRAAGLIVIGDAKRGDIGISASHYAAGCLSDQVGTDEIPGPDALTINAYFGSDGITPFVDVAKAEGKGLFSLVRTSNPSGDSIQNQQLIDGRTVAQMVAQIIADLGEEQGCIGESGYSLLGAVVGATKPDDAATLRKIMSRQIFLVPGFGAQGGGADDVKACFNEDGLGAIITASRSIIYAFSKDEQADWKSPIRDAANEMRAQIAEILA